MDNEQLQEQFDALYEKSKELEEQFLARSSLKVMLEAKRFAKTHRLLVPYIYACFLITNKSQGLFEPEIGTDNAMEIIALVENEDAARKFQSDFDQDHYDYTVHWVSACAYDNLAVHTAVRNGYNSPMVHGAVDDGIHVCRRTGKLECVECFREYAVRICLASGNYEMGEHHARLCATSTTREPTRSRRFIGYKDLIELSILQGKFQAALETLDAAFPFAKEYHDPKGAQNDLFRFAQQLFLLCGKEDELDDYLTKHGVSREDLPTPSLEEAPDTYELQLCNDALALTVHGQPLEAAEELKKWERYLLSRDILDNWFAIRIQRIAALLIARDTGLTIEDSIDNLANELRERASQACQWSAIMSLDAMLHRSVKLNPLGIAYPIDLGSYATEGTPISHSQLELMLPLFEKASHESENAQDSKSDDTTKEKSSVEILVDSWMDELTPLWEEEEQHKLRQFYFQQFQEESDIENPGQEIPFEKQDLLLETERKIHAHIMEYSPETQSRPGEAPIEEEDFFALTRPLQQMRILHDAKMISDTWNWLNNFARKYPENGRGNASLAFYAYRFSEIATKIDVDPKSFGFPVDEELEQLAAKAFAMEPNRTGVATTAGIIFHARGNTSEAQRCFSRACQLDRGNEYATYSLITLYEESERPKDALAIIDLHARAGGRNPLFLQKAMDIAFQNDMPQPFLLYHDAYLESQENYPHLQARHIWALMKTEHYIDALKKLDELDGELKEPTRDRLFTRALCYIEGEKNETKFFEALDAALDLTGDPSSERLLGTAFEPCALLWPHVKEKCAQTELRRYNFERFLYERGFLKWDFFSEDEDENENETKNDESELEMRGLYRCVLRQPLTPDIQAYAGWVRIPREDPAYGTTWLVIAENEAEASTLALQAQSRCYPIGAEVFECEQVDVFYSNESRIANHGNRFPGENLSESQSDL